MRINKKQEQFTPWQTQQEAMFASAIVHQVVENHDIQQDRSEQLVKQKPKIRPQIMPKRKITSIYSILRLKTEKNMEQSEQKSMMRKKKEGSPVRQIKPMNTNLISIINTYQETSNRINPQNSAKKTHGKRFLKQHSKLQKINRNPSVQTPQFLHPTTIDIKKLKQSLFEKKNPSLQTLIKARQQLQKIQGLRQSPILRTYSVQNIKLNAIEEKSRTLEEVGKFSGRKETKSEFNSTISSKMRQTVRGNQSGDMIRPRLKSCVNLDQGKKHIIDRLYDRFC